MTDDKLPRLSRRRVLGTMGALGAGAALGGAGTSAFFSDEETFKNNRLVAGSLDLKIDWEEHYHLTNEQVMVDDNGTMGVLWSDPDDPNYVGFPDPMNPMVWVHRDALEEYMDLTSIEAYPDENGDGIQDQDVAGNPVFPDEESICATDSDQPTSLASPLRTQNDDTILNSNVDQNGDPRYAPLINLDDVKPGDFGELTLSYHLCDNPGYVWMWGALVNASENGVTEPEAADPDEKAGVVELLDAIQTTFWYDTNGNNVIDGGTGEAVCMHLVLDSSGSMTATDGDGVTRQDEMKAGAKQLAQAVLNANPDNTVGVTEFDSDANLLQAQTSDFSQVEAEIDLIDAQGGTAIDTGINTGDTELGNCPEDTRHVMVVVTDGQNNDGTSPVQTASDNAIADNTDEIFAIGTGGASQATLNAIANPDDDAHIQLTSDLTNAIANLTEVVLGEEVFFRGSLREALEVLSTGNGIPLDGNRGTQFQEVIADGGEITLGDPTDPNRDCFAASDTQHIGMAWYLPPDHANEIQTDSVSFDIGFYTEQCRHNTGEGLNPTIPTRLGSGFAKLSEDTNQSGGYGQDGENFNDDETTSGGARARFGNNGPSGAWELAVGDEPGSSGEFSQANYVWTSGQTVDWEVNYDESTDELSFTFDGTSLSDTLDDPQPDGRFAIQGKADEGTVMGSIEELEIGGEAYDLSGSNMVTATNDGEGRDIEYLVVNTSLDGETSFTITGTATVTLQGDYGGSQEGVAFDVVFE